MYFCTFFEHLKKNLDNEKHWVKMKMNVVAPRKKKLLEIFRNKVPVADKVFFYFGLVLCILSGWLWPPSLYLCPCSCLLFFLSHSSRRDKKYSLYALSWPRIHVHKKTTTNFLTPVGNVLLNSSINCATQKSVLESFPYKKLRNL